jgi:glycosyltransferase involved in cell wall biosynthesis
VRRLLVVYPEGDSPHALRIVRPLARYLPDVGWAPVLLTAAGQGAELGLPRIEVPARTVGRARAGAPSPADGADRPATGSSRRAAVRAYVGRHVAIPDRYNRWAVRAARTVQDIPGFDGVLSSGPPHSAHLVGARLRRRRGIPWVADMRDPWSTNHYTTYSPVTRFLDKRIEIRLLRRASAVVTVSDELAATVAALHRRPVHTVTNVFDPAEFADFPPPVFDPLTLCYAGSLIGGRRRPDTLMAAVAGLRRRLPHVPVRVLVFSDQPEVVAAAAHAAGVADVVSNRPWVDRGQVLAAWRRSSVLVLLRWADQRDEGVPTGKLFEYLGAGRPVLSLGGAAGVVGRILAETGAGQHCDSAAAATAWLERLVTCGAAPPTGVASYSAPVMARRFAQLLEQR